MKETCAKGCNKKQDSSEGDGEFIIIENNITGKFHLSSLYLDNMLRSAEGGNGS
jgi:hypothetical protein